MRLLAVISGVLALTGGLAVGLTHAQTYPSKPIKIIVAYPAGQGTDIAARYLAEQVGKDLGQPMIIDNKPGAGGNLGTELTAQAPADGYTLTMGTNATHVLNEFLYAKLPFDPARDFEPVALVGTFPMIVAVNSSSSIMSATDLLEAAKKQSRGADIAMPSTTARLVVEMLKDRTKVPLFGVPYKGSGAAMTDVLGGQLPVIVDTRTALRPHMTSGKVRAIGVTSSQPSALVPGVKTMVEQGVQGFDVVAWNAVYAPKGTPPAVVAQLNAAFNKALERPETQAKLLELGLEPGGGSPARLADFAKSERSKWQPVIQAAGLKAD